MTNKKLIDHLKELKFKSAPEGHRYFTTTNDSFIDDVQPTYNYRGNKFSLLIVPPERRMIKFSQSKSTHDIEYLNVSIPWQTLVMPLSYNYATKEFRPSSYVYYAFSHRNPLTAINLERIASRKSLFHMAYVPNVSPGGAICLGQMQDEFCDDKGVLWANRTFKLKGNSNDDLELFIPTILLNLYENFFTGVFNPDYQSSNDRNITSFHGADRYFDSSWTIPTVTKRKFHYDLRKSHSSKYNYGDFTGDFINNRFWNCIFS